MSRFADPFAVETIDLGPCQCPGTPHERDEARVRWSLSGSALARIGRAELDKAVMRDPFASYRQMVVEALDSWNLLWLAPGTEGEERKPVPVPITSTTIAELDTDTLKPLAEKIDALIEERGRLPNSSGAPSVESSLESASPTRRPSPKPTT